MCQIFISEKARPSDIANWLETATNGKKTVHVIGSRTDKTVQHCIAVAQSRGFQPADLPTAQ